MYTFYYHPGACSMAAHMVLEECGAEYEAVHVNLGKGEQHTGDYLKVNPKAKVPALAVDGRIVTENAVLLPFIADLFPEANLLPADPIDRANCISIIAWLSTTLHIAHGYHARTQAYIGPGLSEAAIEEISPLGLKKFWDRLCDVDALLEGKTWLMGDQLTVADPYVFVFYSWGHDKGLPVGDLKNFTAMKDRLIARPGIRRALEDEGNPLVKAA